MPMYLGVVLIGLSVGTALPSELLFGLSAGSAAMTNQLLLLPRVQRSMS